MRFRISYDLTKKPQKAYTKIHQAIKDLGGYRALLSQWEVDINNITAEDLITHFLEEKCIDEKDRMSIICLDSPDWSDWNPLRRQPTVR